MLKIMAFVGNSPIVKAISACTRCTAVQGWAVNKRRVKRLLKTMNKDEWRAALNPSSATDTSPTTIATPSEADGTTPTGADMSRGSSSAKAPRATDKAAKAAAKAAADNVACRSGADICDTAPASPGSPPATVTSAARDYPTAKSAAATVAEAPTANPVADTVSSSSTGTADSSASAASAEVVLQLEQPPREPSAHPAAPWDEADGSESVTAEVDGGDGRLSESLTLEPDFELEPGVDLKADLGLAVADEAMEAGFHHSEAGEETGEGDGDQLPVDGGDEISAGERSDDLGFEMIDKDEAVGAAAGAGSLRTGNSGAIGGAKARKGWPWAWGRS